MDLARFCDVGASGNVPRQPQGRAVRRGAGGQCGAAVVGNVVGRVCAQGLVWAVMPGIV